MDEMLKGLLVTAKEVSVRNGLSLSELLGQPGEIVDDWMAGRSEPDINTAIYLSLLESMGTGAVCAKAEWEFIYQYRQIDQQGRERIRLAMKKMLFSKTD